MEARYAEASSDVWADRMDFVVHEYSKGDGPEIWESWMIVTEQGFCWYLKYWYWANVVNSQWRESVGGLDARTRLRPRLAVNNAAVDRTGRTDGRTGTLASRDRRHAVASLATMTTCDMMVGHSCAPPIRAVQWCDTDAHCLNFWLRSFPAAGPSARNSTTRHWQLDSSFASLRLRRICAAIMRQRSRH